MFSAMHAEYFRPARSTGRLQNKPSDHVAVEDEAGSIALTTSDVAEMGGLYQFCSDEFTFQDLAATYKRVTGADFTINTLVSVEACKQAVAKVRADAEESGGLNSRWYG